MYNIRAFGNRRINETLTCCEFKLRAGTQVNIFNLSCSIGEELGECTHGNGHGSDFATGPLLYSRSNLGQ